MKREQLLNFTNKKPVYDKMDATMSKAIEEQANKKRRASQAKLWERNPLSLDMGDLFKRVM